MRDDVNGMILVALGIATVLGCCYLLGGGYTVAPTPTGYVVVSRITGEATEHNSERRYYNPATGRIQEDPLGIRPAAGTVRDTLPPPAGFVLDQKR